MNEIKIWKVGERSRALCPSCDRLVETTFRLRPILLEETGTTVEDVLVDVCDRCGHTVSIPPQSTPRLIEARERTTRKLEVRVPRHLADVLALVSQELEASQDLFTPFLLRYYLRECSKSRSFARWVGRLASDRMLSGPRDARISLRLTQVQWDVLSRAEKASAVADTSQLINSFILAAWHDVIHTKSTKRRKELERIAELVG